MDLVFAPSQIESWPIDRLRPYARNAKMHGDDQVAKIAASMAKFGWTVPCMVADDGELIAGHGRVPLPNSVSLPQILGKKGSMNLVAILAELLISRFHLQRLRSACIAAAPNSQNFIRRRNRSYVTSPATIQTDIACLRCCPILSPCIFCDHSV